MSQTHAQASSNYFRAPSGVCAYVCVVMAVYVGHVCVVMVIYGGRCLWGDICHGFPSDVVHFTCYSLALSCAYFINVFELRQCHIELQMG